MEEKKDKRRKHLLDAAITGGAYEKVQRYGEAVKQHYAAYSGRDQEKELSKGLKSISKSKVNKKNEFSNIHQQAGFSAEVKSVARSNADDIINGKKARKIRTDDLGRVNDPLFDTVQIDNQGQFIEGSQTQIKFIGASQNDPGGAGNASRALQKLQSKQFKKYLDNDAKIEVQSDQYEKIMGEADVKIEKLSEQLKNQKNKGNVSQTNKLKGQIDDLKKIKKSLRKSSLSGEEAVFARKHPKLSTAKDVGKVSHRAGMDTAKSSALIGGSVSIVRNAVAMSQGEIEKTEAVKNIARDTAHTAALGYGTGFTGAAIKGAMQNSQKAAMRAASKTNVPGIMVSVTVSSAKTLNRYFAGEIDERECLEDLGETNTGMVSSAMFAAVGQAVIPVPVLGGLIGGMVGYTLSSSTYSILMQSLKEEEMAKEERICIESACKEHIKMIREYRKYINTVIDTYLCNSMEIFDESFAGINDALALGDAEWFIESANRITKEFGGEASFSSMNEFEDMMSQNETFKL